MAGLQQRGGGYRIIFRFHGKQHTLALGRIPSKEADAKAAQVGYLLLADEAKHWQAFDQLSAIPPNTTAAKANVHSWP